MIKTPIYTIGHGARKIEEFISLLKEYNVEFLIDVRSTPYSKFNPMFNQNELKFYLESNSIKYVFMGESLGGRPKDVSCYNDQGKVDYSIVRNKEFFLRGIERLKVAYSKNIRVVLMCSESKPCECHRSKLIGEVLCDYGIVMQHIDVDNKIKDQNFVINELNKGLFPEDLFGNSLYSTSRKKYR